MYKYSINVPSTNCTCSELYPAEESDKTIIPVVYESIDYQLSDKAMGVKYILGGLEHMHFIPNLDDYEFSLDKLVDALKQHCEDHID